MPRPLLASMLALSISLAIVAQDKAAAPEATRIYFVSVEQAPDTPPAIHSMNLDGKDRRRVGKSDEHEYDPVLSRDGKLLAFTAIETKAKDTREVRHSRISIMNTDGGQRRKITGDDEWAYNPVWSPDGARLVYCSIKPGTTGMEVLTTSRICVINADGKGRVELADGFSPSWMPDGKEVMYVKAVKLDEYQFRSFRLIPDGKSQPKAMEIATGGMPVHSPDGKWIAYIAVADPEGLAVFLTSADGKERRRLSEPPVRDVDAQFTGDYMEMECGWSNDGKHLFVTRLGPDHIRFRVHVFDVATGKRTQLTPAAKDDLLFGTGLAAMRYR